MTRDEVRELIAKAVFGSTVEHYTGTNNLFRIDRRELRYAQWHDVEQEPFYQFAEAVLAAFAARGIVIGTVAEMTAADFGDWTVEWQHKDTGISEWFSDMPNSLALVRVVE